MNSNELLYFLRGFVQLSDGTISKDQWARIRGEVNEAYPVETFVVNTPPRSEILPPKAGCGGCGGAPGFKPRGAQ